MTMAELETAVREKAKVIAVVFDNERYGTIRMHQDARGGMATASPPISARSTSPRSPGPAERGGSGWRRDAAFELAVRQAIANDRPTVIQVALDRGRVSPDRPFAPGG